MREVDVSHLGNPYVLSCFAVEDVIVDPGPESSLRTLLEALDNVPTRILLTHIHLDHAGAAGTLVRRWPEVEVWVHERGAPHLIDPSKLVASATRLYGDDMARLWGEIAPVPERNMRVLAGGERIGPWRVQYTPGHAWHHVSFLHEPSGTAFIGDVGGVRIDGGPIFPPTPPPDIDLEAWHASVDAVAAWDPARLAITHFGTVEDVAEHTAGIHAALDHWGALALELDEDAFTDAALAEMRSAPDPAAADAYVQAMPPDRLWPGLQRYWSRRQADVPSGDRSPR